ncbi:MAG: DNA mismatch repair protein MutS [Gammaproteobacteria bacterium]|nr:DNA mismatch repair protein MutS [Gammaproteobacteria bacterium]
MSGVRRLHSDRPAPQRPRPHPRARSGDDELNRPPEVGPADADHPESTYARPEVTRATLRRLRRGRYAIDDELDLHGMTVSEASAALDNFLAAAARCRCVRIVHGKGKGSGRGGPVLRPNVHRWLRQRREVLAFTAAREVDGGTGASYVLLRG